MSKDLYCFITPTKKEQQHQYQHLFQNLELNEFANIPATIPRYINSLLEKLKLLEQNQLNSNEWNKEAFKKQELYISQLNKLSRQQQVEIDNLQGKLIQLNGQQKDIKQHVDQNEIIGFKKIDEVKQNTNDINKNVSKEMRGFLRQQQDFYNEIKEKFVSKEHFKISLFKETADHILAQYPQHYREILQIEKLESNLKVQIEMVERNLRLEQLKVTDQIEEIEKKLIEFPNLKRQLEKEQKNIKKIQEIIKDQELESIQLFKTLTLNKIEDKFSEMENQNNKVFQDLNIKFDHFKQKLNEINDLSQKLLQNTQKIQKINEIQHNQTNDIEHLQQVTKYCKNNLETLKILIKDEFTQKQKQEGGDINNANSFLNATQNSQNQKLGNFNNFNKNNNTNNMPSINNNNIQRNSQQNNKFIQKYQKPIQNNNQINNNNTNNTNTSNLINNMMNRMTTPIRSNNTLNSNNTNNSTSISQNNNQSIKTPNLKQRSITPLYKNQKSNVSFNNNNINNKTLDTISQNN